MRLQVCVAVAALVGACGDDSAAPDALPADAPIIDAPATQDAAGDAGVACAVTPTHVVTGFRGPSITVNADVEQTIALPNGFLVQGTVTLPNAPPAQITTSYAMAYNDATQTVYSSYDLNPTPASFHYQMVLPAGRYRLKFAHAVDVYWDPNSSTLNETYVRNAYESIDVCGDVTHDVTLRELGPITRQDVTVRNLDHIENGAGGYSVGVAYRNDSDTLGYEVDSIPVGAPTATVMLDLPQGLTQVDAYGPWLSGSLFDVTIPQMVTISGAISKPSTLSPASLFAQCVPLEPQVFPDGLVNQGLGGSGYNESYSFNLAPGTNCALVLGASFETTLTGWFLDPAPSPSISETFTTNVTRDFAMPDLTSQLVTIRVVDSNGQPVRISVGVSSTSLSPPATGAWFGSYVGDLSGVDTDVNGRIQFRVPPGAYDVHLNKAY